VKPIGIGIALTAAAMVALSVTGSSGAATMTTLALWNMNEAPGSHTLVDASGNRINGTIGTEVVLNGAVHRFGFLKPNTPPAHPHHIDVVNSSRLNPGTLDYSVTIRAKWTNAFGNIIQKGQAGAVGGYFKLQAPNGLVQCLFRGATGSAGVSSKRALNDGRWHVVTCTRTATQVSMTVDGVVTMTISHATGAISNNVPLTIAGKSNCDQIKITCDYFAGQIDYVQIRTS
jgi:Concanavalin A-like lectin/glucanases superfamily